MCVITCESILCGEMATVDSCLVAIIVARLYPRTSTLEAALKGLRGKGDFLLPADSGNLRRTCTAAIVAWNSRRTFVESIGLFGEDKSYELPMTRGMTQASSSAVLERVVRSSKHVSSACPMQYIP